MSLKAETVIVLGIPSAVVLGPLFLYGALVVAGVDRELALNSQLVAVAIGVTAILHGLRRSGRSTWWPMQLGALLAVLVATAALALRAISLASRPGPMFFFCIVSASILGYVAHRVVRQMLSRQPEEEPGGKSG